MRKGLSTILYLFLGLPITLSALFCLAVKPWALDRAFYKRVIEDRRLYAALRSPDIARGVDARLEFGGFTFSGPALVTALQPRLPEKELTALGHAAIDQTFDALESGAQNRPDADLMLDMRPLKASLLAMTDAAAEAYVRALPVRDESPNPADLSFRPASIAPARMDAETRAALGKAATSIPDVVSNTLRIDAGIKGRSVKAAFDQATATLTGFAFALIAGLALLGGGGAVSVLSRAGSYLIPPSVLILVPGVILSMPWTVITRKAMPGMPAELARFLASDAGRAFHEYLGAVLGPMGRSFFVAGLVGLSLGAALKSLRRIFEPHEV